MGYVCYYSYLLAGRMHLLQIHYEAQKMEQELMEIVEGIEICKWLERLIIFK